MSEARAEREALERQRQTLVAPGGASAALGADDMISFVVMPGDKEREVGTQAYTCVRGDGWVIAREVGGAGNDGAGLKHAGGQGAGGGAV